jgi:hypothetical protein
MVGHFEAGANKQHSELRAAKVLGGYSAAADAQGAPESLRHRTDGAAAHHALLNGKTVEWIKLPVARVMGESGRSR